MIKAIEVYNGFIPVNTYFYLNAKGHGFLIDPGAQSDVLSSIIDREKYVIEKILITHGHYDHIGAASELSEKYDAPIVMQCNGRKYAENPRWNLSADFGSPMTLQGVIYPEDFSDVVLSDGSLGLKLIPTPGHTEDGATYYSERDGVAFTGDTIFCNSYGRTDLYGGDETTLVTSIRRQILTLPQDTILLSGHSEPTTVKDELTRPWYK